MLLFGDFNRLLFLDGEFGERFLVEFINLYYEFLSLNIGKFLLSLYDYFGDY